MLLNCRSLLPCIDELRLIFKEAKPGIIAITETWLDDSVADHEIHIAGYNIIRKDRQFRRGGGCAIYSAEGIKLKHRQDLEHNEHEVLCSEIKIQNLTYLFCCVYKAPNCSTNAFFDYLGDVLRSKSGQGK